MAFLSQASHLGSLLLPHDAFQEHAAHPPEWSEELSSKGSESTCILSSLATFLHCACTAHSDLVIDGSPHMVRRVLNSGGIPLEVEDLASYALRMNQHPAHPDIY